jgi:hypothetical protein
LLFRDTSKHVLDLSTQSLMSLLIGQLLWIDEGIGRQRPPWKASRPNRREIADYLLWSAEQGAVGSFGNASVS